MKNKSVNRDLYDLLVTRDFDPELLDASGQAITDPAEAELFSFDWKTSTHNYGTVVILMGNDGELSLYFGDNLGRTMESDDKSEWYQFLHQIKQFASRNFMTFSPKNINRLGAAMKSMAALKESLFEGYYGNRRTSYSDQPQKTRIIIQHSRPLEEGDARYRNIAAIFVENSAGERFRMRTRQMIEARAQARHVAQGGTPYDPFGQHISSMVEEAMVLSRFRRAKQNRVFEGDTQDLVEQAETHYQNLKRDLRSLATERGYRKIREGWQPLAVTEQDQTVDDIRQLFVENSIDPRIESALPIMARLRRHQMSELAEFETWTDKIVEGTWALPDTPEKQRQLQSLMSKELTVGPDATNATEQLYDVIGDDQLFDILDDIALVDPDANIWQNSRVQHRLAELGIEVPAAPDTGPDAVPVEESGELVTFEPVRPRNIPKEGDIHDVSHPNLQMLPGFRDTSTGEDYSDTYYYRDPMTNGIFAVYTHGHRMRVRGTDGMSEERVDEIVQTLENIREDLDTDGVMMDKPSNMSS